MILTRTHLNGARQGARKLLGSPQAMHAAILAGFPPDTDPGRVLWRVDQRLEPSPLLYVLSTAQPDFAHLDEQAGWPTRRMAESVDFGPFLSQLSDRQSWSFRLTANPTHRGEVNGRQRVLAHVTEPQQRQWLVDRAEHLGVDFAVESLMVTERRVDSFRRGNATVTLGIATFTGALVVRDADRLRSALVAGVGRAKAYGCGLLTLARL